MDRFRNQTLGEAKREEILEEMRNAVENKIDEARARRNQFIVEAERLLKFYSEDLSGIIEGPLKLSPYQMDRFINDLAHEVYALALFKLEEKYERDIAEF